MAVLFGYHRAFSDHEPGPGHPESTARLQAVREGIAGADLGDAIIEFSPRPATRLELERVHTQSQIDQVELLSGQGGGVIDGDTRVSERSFFAAQRAAGAGIDAVERLDKGQGSAAFLALRPPGHHADGKTSMGFCLFNSLAVTAAALVARGDRVLVLDWDAHHGNGTQDIFYDSPDVLFVSFHQSPLYPGSGAIADVGSGAGRGTTINVPFPRKTTGDSYRLAFDTLIGPAVEQFSPNWLLVSAGFDAHRRDPLTDLGLSAGDFADFTARAMTLVAPGRRIFFLEGGYDYEALSNSVAATVSTLAGKRIASEQVTGDKSELLVDATGSPASIVAASRSFHEGARFR